MEYIEYKFILNPTNPWNEVLISYLSDCEFNTFIEHNNGFSAFITHNLDNEQNVINILNDLPENIEYSYKKQILPDINWNEEWEKNFEPIIVENQIYLHADFHDKKPEIPYQINIQPKMSFGTGHHETTYLMLKLMINLDFTNKNVLDMGCGTSVLAIFAKMKNAKSVLAIDNDVWAYENSLENKKRNSSHIEVKLGDADLIKESSEKFDVILANINKNILLQDMEIYKNSLEKNGILMMSGIYSFDFEDILEQAESLNLKFINKETKNNWISVKFSN